MGRPDLCIPCYSTQSIEELLGARDEKKRTALDLQLDAVGAKCLETLSETEGGMPTGYTISVKDREQRGQIYDDMQRFSSVGGFGLGDLLQKSIGGISSLPYDDILRKAQEDIECLLDLDVSGLPLELADTLLDAAANMKERARQNQHELHELMKLQDDFRLQQLAPASINNFTGSGAFERIIETARSQEGTLALVEEFLNKPTRIPPKRADAHLGTPCWEQVFRSSHLLFLLGYWREPKHRKDTERARVDFSGGQADISHISNAFFCSVFHTSDKPQAQLAAAVYDHLNVPTAVILYAPKNDVETVLYTPTRIQVIDE